MQRHDLLVLDVRGETCDQINSLLRNAGLNVTCTPVQTAGDLRKALERTDTMMVIADSGADSGLTLTELIQLGGQHGVPVVLRVATDRLGELESALAAGPFWAVDRADEASLIRLVQHHAGLMEQRVSIGALQKEMSDIGERYRLLLSGSREPTAYLHEGLHVDANPAYLELTRIGSLEELRVVSLLDLATGREDDLKQILRELHEGRLPGRPIAVDIRATDASPPVQADMEFSPARYEGEECIQVRILRTDAPSKLREALHLSRSVDQVTGLANRTRFLEQLSQKLGETAGETSKLGLTFVQPDHPYRLLADLGITAFETLVREMGELVRACAGEHDLVSHFTDSGFMVLSELEGSRTLTQVAEATRSALGNLDSTAVADSFSCSFGVTQAGQLTRDAGEAIRQAMTAWMEAAELGGQIMRYRPAAVSNAGAADAGHWAERIRFALNHDALFSVQHSIVNLEGETEGLYESRTFIREDSGNLPDREFLVHAERADLGAAIDRHMIPGLLHSIAGTGDRHLFAISENSILDFSFPSWFQHQLEDAGTEGTQVVLQVAARSAAEHRRELGRIMSDLTSQGCRFAMDDIDASPARMRLMEQLSFDYVKLKPELTSALRTNPDNQAHIRNIVNAAERSGTQVVAHNVTDTADLAVLWQCGVKLVSGNFLSESGQMTG